MNIAIKLENLNSREVLADKEPLVTGSTSGALTVFLASDAAASTTGIALPVDGGRTAH